MSARMLAAAVCIAISGCDVESTDTAPADYERAKADCAPHGGLRSVTTMNVLLRSDRVDAVCADGARISRKPAPLAGSPS